jgi:hypothetical protein
MSVMMMSFGTMPLGVVPVTLAADAWGAPAAIIAAQVVGLAVVGVIFGISGQLRGLQMEGMERTELSPAQAARLVAEGQISAEEGARLSGRSFEPSKSAAPAPAGAPRGRDDRGQAAG